MKKNMKSLSFLLLLPSFMLLFSCTSQSTPDISKEIDPDAPLNTLTSSESENGWQLLFDGTSIDQWHGYNMEIVPDCWLVQDGIMLINNSGLGESNMGIVTNKEFESFAFSFEFQLTPEANSGVMFQVREDTIYTYPYQTGVEYQLIDHENWPGPIEDWQICAANYAMHPPMVREYKEIGEWNHGMIISEGDHVRFYLNGNMTVVYEKYSPEWTELRNSGKWSDYPDYGKFDKGHIALQNHGAVVYFKNLKIKEL